MAGWRQKLDEWETAGLLDPAQARRIREHEDAADTGLAAWQEALGYLGATLALSAGALLVEDLWTDLTVVARLALVGALATALTVIGGALGPAGAPARQRLASLLLAAGTLAVAWLAGLTAAELLDWDEAAVVLAVGALAGMHAGVAWWWQQSPLQELAAFAAAVTVVAGLLLLPAISPAPLYVGLAVWGLGAAWAVLAQAEVVRPVRTGTAVGLLAIGVGAQIAATGDARVVGLWLGLASTAAVLAVGAVRANVLPLGFGAAGIAVFVPQMVFHLFADTVAAPIALLVVGVLVAAVAVSGIRLVRDRGEPERSQPAGEPQEAGQ